MRGLIVATRLQSPTLFEGLVVYPCFLKTTTYTLFVYRLGQRVFSPLRGVRLSYRVPDLITLVAKPVGGIEEEISSRTDSCYDYTKDGNETERWIQ